MLGLITLSASVVMAQGGPEESDEEGEEGAAPAKAAPAPAPAPKAPAPTIGLDYQVKVWEIVNGSTARINDCLERHLQFQPAAAGTVELQLDVAGDGRMMKVGTKSALPASEKLQQCLKFIAQSWKFPKAEGVEKFSTSLQIRVAKGQKFTLAKPGEKAPAKKEAAKPADTGFLGFSPNWSSGFTQ